MFNDDERPGVFAYGSADGLWRPDFEVKAIALRAEDPHTYGRAVIELEIEGDALRVRAIEGDLEVRRCWGCLSCEHTCDDGCDVERASCVEGESLELGCGLITLTIAGSEVAVWWTGVSLIDVTTGAVLRSHERGLDRDRPPVQ